MEVAGGGLIETFKMLKTRNQNLTFRPKFISSKTLHSKTKENSHWTFCHFRGRMLALRECLANSTFVKIKLRNRQSMMCFELDTIPNLATNVVLIMNFQNPPSTFILKFFYLEKYLSHSYCSSYHKHCFYIPKPVFEIPQSLKPLRVAEGPLSGHFLNGIQNAT
ncbi:hypothetical protein FF38_00724 [Lucilia cuprina]|uniref:Uncharacterized protein n=1 Tax=Lucilia cuprina TaxID=7375 RepID=A0A0L0CSQ3_LUCCU|nr:hypothetical protein FF38_00724 [Lucilia cuprina]